MAKPRQGVLGYLERSIAIGLVLSALSIALLSAGALLNGSPAAVLSAIGSVLLTVAILSFLYDPFLRQALTDEIFDRLRLRETLATSGIVDAGAVTETFAALSDRLSGPVTAVPVNPPHWVQTQFPLLIARAKESALQLSVYLTAPDVPYTTTLAERLMMPEAALQDALVALPDQLVSAWNQVTRERPESTLQVFYVAGVPSFGATHDGNEGLVELSHLLHGPSIGFTCTSLVIDLRGEMGNWLKESFDLKNEANPPTLAGMNPLPATTPSIDLRSTESGEDDDDQ